MLLEWWVFEAKGLIFTSLRVKMRSEASKTHLERSMNNIKSCFTTLKIIFRNDALILSEIPGKIPILPWKVLILPCIIRKSLLILHGKISVYLHLWKYDKFIFILGVHSFAKNKSIITKKYLQSFKKYILRKSCTFQCLESTVVLLWPGNQPLLHENRICSPV